MSRRKTSKWNKQKDDQQEEMVENNRRTGRNPLHGVTVLACLRGDRGTIKNHWWNCPVRAREDAGAMTVQTGNRRLSKNLELVN